MQGHLNLFESIGAICTKKKIWIQLLKLHKDFLQWNESQKERRCGFSEKQSEKKISNSFF